MKNYVLCATLEEDCLKVLKTLKSDIDLKHATIHLVTVVEIQIYNSELSPVVYPTELQFADIEKSVTKRLLDLQHALGLEDHRTVIKCFFEFNREKKILSYLKEVKADLVVTATRGKHGIEGFFSSSFTDYLTKFSPCDILVMRPKK